MSKRWARIWFSFEADDKHTIGRRLHELSIAAEKVGFHFEAGRAQENQPEGEWEDRPELGRVYGPPLGEAEP